MAISITQLLGTDNVALSRLTINANFNALKAGYDAMATLLNPDLSSLNVKSIQVDNTASSLSATIFSVSKGASILGNLTVGTTGQATTVTVNGTGGVNISNASLILTNGNLALSNAASLFSTAGNLSVSGGLRLPGLTTSQSNAVTLAASGTTIDVTTPEHNKYVFLSNGSTAAATPLSCAIGTGAAGQVLEIFHVLGPSGPSSITTTNFSGITGDIIFHANGDKIKCIFEGGSWHLVEAIPAQYVSSIPSIEFTRTSTGSTYVFAPTIL